MKKILMLSQAEFPPDIRLEKEIKSLYENDFSTLVVCNQYDKTKNPSLSYCDIKRVRAVFKSVWINKIINFPLFFNPKYLITVLSNIIKFSPDVIHAHDLPMMPLAILFGKLFRLKIVFDMHENYPEALKVFKKRGLLNFIFKNYRLASYLERFCIKYSDKIIVVVEENKERLISRGVRKEKIAVVSNTVDLQTFRTDLNIVKHDWSFSIDSPVILYTGTISPERDLITPILSMNYLKEIIPKPVLIIIGKGPQKRDLINLVKSNNLESMVEFLDWVAHEDLSFYISKAKICTVPQPANDFINTTIPHKLFEYMALSKPLLVSDAEPFKRIITETEAGLTFKSSDPLDYSEKVKMMLRSGEPWGENGKNSVRQKYNWENDSRILLNLYNNL